jgi:hypothetical protein
VDEVARMLGGIKITDKTRHHAEEMVRGSTLDVTLQNLVEPIGIEPTTS